MSKTTNEHGPVKDVREQLNKPFQIDDNLLQQHEFRQEGRVLVCIDNPSITAVLPLGVYLQGEKGAYRLEKLF